MKTARLTSLTLLLFASLNMNAQTFNHDWTFNGGNTSAGITQSVVTDASGNVYTAGYFSGTTDFDPGAGQMLVTSQGYRDIFITKINSSGTLQWAYTFGSKGNDEGNVMKLDASGNVYLSGYFSNTVDFDPGADSFFLQEAPYTWNGIVFQPGDIFLLKLNNSGQFQWARSIPLPGYDYATDLAPDQNGNILITGKVGFDEIATDSFNINPSGTPVWFYTGGGLLAKFSSTGNLQWAGELGKVVGAMAPPYKNMHNIQINSAAVDANNRFIVVGSFAGLVDFDFKSGVANYTAPSSNSNMSMRSGFMAQYANNGNLIKVQTFGTSNIDCEFNQVRLDASDVVYIVGAVNGTVDFDPSSAVLNLTPAGTNKRHDALILKYKKSWAIAWGKLMGGNAEDKALSLSVDGSGDIYSTGYFYGTADFNPGSSKFNIKTNGEADVFISKLNQSGNFVWARRLGGKSVDMGWDIAITQDANTSVYTGGLFNDTCDFDQEAGVYLVSSGGNQDFFLHKMSHTGTEPFMGHAEDLASESASMFLYPNPAVNNLHLANTSAEVISSMYIVNHIGQKWEVSANEFQSGLLDISFLNSGCYTLHIESESKVTALSFMKY